MNSTTIPAPGNVQVQSLPVIADHEIAIDEHGRFNLNAIHKASGEGKGKAPSTWTVTKQSKELVEELSSQTNNSGFEPIVSFHGGAHRGTYAHELLAVSYAGWISPRFQLQVNQVFLDYRMGKLQSAEQDLHRHVSDAGPEQQALPNPLSPRHQRDIQKTVARRCQALPEASRRTAYSRLYGHLKDRFEVGSYKDIDDSRYTEALGAVQSFSLEGDWLEAEREPDASVFTDEDLSDLYILLCHVDRICRKWREYDLSGALRSLQSPATSEMCEHISMADAFKNRLTRNKGDLMEVSRRRLGVNYGILNAH